MSLSKEELNRIALSYHEGDAMRDKFIEDECQYHTYDWVFQQIRTGEKVLELGYGEGNFTEELIRRGFRPTVIDGSDILLDKARKLYQGKVETVHELFENFEPAQKFDCVLATHVLEHVDQPVSLLLKMKDWINSSGRIVIIVPNKESLHRQLAVMMGLQPELDTLGARDKLVGHQRVYSIKTLTDDVEKAGLKASEVCGFFLKMLPNSMMLEFSKELITSLNRISPKIPKELLANIGLVAIK